MVTRPSLLPSHAHRPKLQASSFVALSFLPNLLAQYTESPCLCLPARTASRFRCMNVAFEDGCTVHNQHPKG